MNRMIRSTLVLLLASASFSVAAQSAKPPKAAALPAHVQEIVTGRCALCHGPEGESASAVYPRLAAQHPDYLQKQLKDFRDGRRKSDTMSEMAKDLKDEDVVVLAGYFSGKKAGARQPGDVDLAAVGKYIFLRGNSFSGVPACSSCHGPTGAGTAQLPRLAGQHPAYVETQLKEFNKRERTNDNAIMHTVASKLTELETKAVSVYIGGLQ
jgi:cytochrome c553